MAASDLAVLADVRTWLSGSSGLTTSDDALIGRLITDISGAIYAYLSRRSLLPAQFAERYDGNGKGRLYLRNYPVFSIASLVIGETAIAAAPTPGAGVSWQSGYLLDLWDGLPPGRTQALDLRGHCFWAGRQNVLVTYSAGYQVSAEAATVPLSPGPYTITVAAPFGPWASDRGVTYANGAALTPVGSAPAAGQYSVAAGVYTFNVGDAGASVLISYGFIPASINNACIEWVAERYRYRTRIGQSAQSVSGQTTNSWSLKDMPDFIRASLDPYRNVVPA